MRLATAKLHWRSGNSAITLPYGTVLGDGSFVLVPQNSPMMQWQIEISKWLIEVHYENTEEFVETSENTNVVAELWFCGSRIAAFTTANARLKF